MRAQSSPRGGYVLRLGSYLKPTHRSCEPCFAVRLPDLIRFDPLDLPVFWENTKETEWQVWKRMADYFPDLSIEET